MMSKTKKESWTSSFGGLEIDVQKSLTSQDKTMTLAAAIEPATSHLAARNSERNSKKKQKH